MPTMNVSLPEPLKGWVEEQARSGRYADEGAYVRELIRRDQERAAKIARMQALIDEGRASGISDRTVDEIRQAGIEQYEHGAAERGL